MITPLPTSPPSNPLDVQTGTTACTGDSLTAAQKLSTEIKAYVVQIEAAKTSAGYPATMVPPQLDDATITYHGMGDTYALSIVPKLSLQTGTLASTVVARAVASPSPGPGGARANNGRGGAFRVFFGCLPLHSAQPDDIATRHLFAPSGGLFTAPQITFMPSVGLYIQFRAPQAGQESFRIYALPAKAPSAPFEVRATASTCTPELRASATEALGELQAYFATGKKPALWAITAHTASSGTWYELNPGDPAILGSLLMCGRVAAVAPKDIVDKGWDGMMPPEVNYAAPLGLYIIRQVPQVTPNPTRTSGP